MFKSQFWSKLLSNWVILSEVILLLALAGLCCYVLINKDNSKFPDMSRTMRTTLSNGMSTLPPKKKQKPKIKLVADGIATSNSSDEIDSCADIKESSMQIQINKMILPK